MELGELSELLSAQATAGNPVAARSILGKQPALTGMLKRNIGAEMIMVLVFMGAGIARLAWPASGTLHLFCILVIMTGLGFGLLLLRLFRQVGQFERTADTTIATLRSLTRIITRFNTLYRYFTIGSLPVIYIFGLIAGWRDVYALAQPGNFNWTKGFTIYTIAFLAWSAGTLLFSRWYINTMYGRYGEALQQQLDEIENG